jgi:hypothetical protein
VVLDHGTQDGLPSLQKRLQQGDDDVEKQHVAERGPEAGDAKRRRKRRDDAREWTLLSVHANELQKRGEDEQSDTFKSACGERDEGSLSRLSRRDRDHGRGKSPQRTECSGGCLQGSARLNRTSFAR